MGSWENIEVWWNRGFTFAIVVFWLGLLAYSLLQRYRIRKRSESLEVEAELGRSSAQLFHDISGQISTFTGYMYLIEQDAQKGKLDLADLTKLKELSDFLLEYTRNFRHLVANLYAESNKPIALTGILKILVETQPKSCFHKLGIEVIEDYRADGAHVSVHAMEALFNIIRNACEAMHDSAEKRLSISTEQKDDEVEIRITDTGSGIPENLLSKIFTYGFTTKSDGSGQGMTIAKQAVEKAGGNLKLESTVGGGTSITISLPIISSSTANGYS